MENILRWTNFWLDEGLWEFGDETVNLFIMHQFLQKVFKCLQILVVLVKWSFLHISLLKATEKSCCNSFAGIILYMKP